MITNCRYCKRDFITDRKIEKYCSRNCYALSKIKWGKYNKLYIKKCIVCNKEFITRFEKQIVVCCKECEIIKNRIKGKEHYYNSIETYKAKWKKTIDYETRQCLECGNIFKANKKRIKKYCSSNCQYRAEHRNRNHTIRQRTGNSKQRIDIMYLINRDGYRCGICGKRISTKLKHPNPNCLTIDHIIPLAKGGTHTEDNLQIAHLRCNVLKGDKINNIQLNIYNYAIA